MKLGSRIFSGRRTTARKVESGSSNFRLSIGPCRGRAPTRRGLIAQLDTALAARSKVVVHCRQGIGRSGLIAAGLLVAQRLKSRAAMERTSAARKVAVPETPEQAAWITAFAGKLNALSPAHREWP